MQRLISFALGLLCITAAAQQPSSPVSIGIVFDTSGSIGAKLARSRQVAGEFLKASGPEDEFFLIDVNNHPTLSTAFTTNAPGIQDRLAFLQPKGRSALWDGIDMALSEIKKGQHSRKALLVISDGGDNSSHLTESELVKFVQESGIPIYAFGVIDPAPARGRTSEELDGPARLDRIARLSGGRYFAVENLNDIPRFVATVAGEASSPAHK